MRALEKELMGDVFAGQVLPPRIYEKYDLGGVIKSPRGTFDKLHGESLKSFIGKTQKIQQEINEAREDSKLVAHDLAKWYKGEKS